ncbi:microtubule binding motor protein [Lithospermum erythrorhizon]|uniref:Microtubule binding motor protein n=1 Tax=Lithospermum erythrorhizon TaxID=34254 RepID=A0AAV3RL20_LITER
MKHFMLPKKTILKEDHNIESSRSNGSSKKAKSAKENADPNMTSPSTALHSTAKIKSPLPPRPPPSKFRKLNVDQAEIGDDSGGSRAASDSGVQVIVRMRPPNKTVEEGEMIVQKLSEDTLTIGAHTFTFDSIADTEASQADIFQVVGAPLVENCLAGFNSSVFAYGQTGSGKTYTVWGPANALLEESISSDQHGLTPRVFQRLFKRIDEEQTKQSDKQLVYRCRCSFLEIYNEQITDLLDPTQKALQIREDVKAGVYVENLTEEYVSSMKDVIQLLIKGLSNRRTGATSVNSESSRSHSVFTCVVESKSKSLEDGLSYFKTSRINLVDLAGSERQKLTGAAGERLKEAGNINRSLSQLGNLINILAEVSQTGKQRHIPYRDSKLTFLLQESLGGNAKLAMMCAISPDPSCKSETFSTLRFAQRAKAIQNKAIVNEEMKDDVNVLKEVIRQLKEELLRMKANGNQTGQNDSSSRWNARRSLNLLKFSLNRPMTLPLINDDSDEEMEIVEEAEGIIQLAELQVAEEVAIPGRQVSLDTDVSMEEVSEQDNKDELVISDHDEYQNSRNHITFQGNCVNDLISSPKTLANDSYGLSTKVESLSTIMNSIGNIGEPEEILADVLTKEIAVDSGCLEHKGAPRDINLVPSDISPVLLKSPTPSVSPRVLSSSRKSFKSSSSATTQRSVSSATMVFDTTPLSNLNPSNSTCLDFRPSKTSNISSAPTAYLAASLHRGLEIIGSHRRSAALRSFRFSCKNSDMTAIVPVSRVDAGVQTVSKEFEVLNDELRMYLCSKCKTTSFQDELKDTGENGNMQLVPISGLASCSMNQVPKAVEKVLAGAIRREMALEELCARQNSEIMQLNRLVQQYKHERECNAVITQTREDKIARLESLMDGVLESEDFMDEELSALAYEHKLLKEKYESHPDVLRINIELKRAQDELENYKNFCDMGERDVLLEEIQDLRTQLRSYTNSSLKSSKRQNPHILQLTYSSEPKGEAPPLSMVQESVEDIIEKRLEEERNKWVEAESEWITLVEELRLELESTRSLTQKQRQELHMEKKCADELKEAMQLAMEGQARMIEQYSELQEKHIQLLMRHRNIQEGIEDVKKSAAKAGVRGTGLKFINALAAEVSSLKVEREKERRYFRDENKGLQAQLRDTAIAVQAAGELLVRLTEAEEAIAAAEKRAVESEQETDRAYKQIDTLKKNHEKEISAIKQHIVDSRHPEDEEQAPPIFDGSRMAKYDADEIHSTDDQRWKEEFKPFYQAEEEEPSSWFSGYDRCNV